MNEIWHNNMHWICEIKKKKLFPILTNANLIRVHLGDDDLIDCGHYSKITKYRLLGEMGVGLLES